MNPAAPREASPGARGRYANLDFVRFVAAVLVLISHSYTLTARGGEPALFSYETLGGLAVAIFFVISGFLVTGAWHRNPSLLTFVQHRALRIMPGLVGVVAVAALLLGPLLTTLPLGEYFLHPQTRKYFGNLTFTRLHYALPGVFADNPYPHAVNGSLWTLPIEVTMYVVLGGLAALRLLNRVAIALLVAALALAWFGGGAALVSALSPHLPDVLPAAPLLQLALWFFTGSLFWSWRVRYHGGIALLLLGVAWTTQGTFVGHAVLHVAMPYGVLWFAQAELGRIGRFGRHGDFSYGIYLYAFPVQQTFAHFGAARWPLAAYMGACLLVTLGCAALSWRLIEAPALRRKRRSYAPSGEPVGAAAGVPPS